jgi:hypothetical protein
MLYVLIDATGKQRLFRVKAVAELFRDLYGGEVYPSPATCN